MDLSWATQESEAVAEKMLRYRRDASGWKKCREGVSEELGGKRDLETAPRAWSPPNSQASPLPKIIRTLDPRGGLRERFHCGWMLSGTPGDSCPFHFETHSRSSDCYEVRIGPETPKYQVFPPFIFAQNPSPRECLHHPSPRECQGNSFLSWRF